jgi:tRNA-specific 2-thiouridylase
MGNRVVLAMSGGVDSSVAAALLKAQGYDVVGLFMRSGVATADAERRAKTCCSVADALDARHVADRLDIPFYVLDFEREFARIEDYFADEYLAGRTPNPCVVCNIWLKFGRLWVYGKQVGADFVATGHYARIRPAGDGTPRVARAVDRSKDQSYVLFGLRRELLPHVLFPVGEFPKEEIRALGRQQGLPVHDKPDSQEICFVPDDDYLGFVRGRRPDHRTAGAIIDQEGNVLGEHSGIEAFTIGQRRGLGIAMSEPRYVVQIEPRTRTITVGRRKSLERVGLKASRFNWQGPIPEHPIPCLAQIRAQHRAVPATVEALPGGGARVVFETAQTAITPGQVVTVYQDDLVLGGGWIEGPIEEPEGGV